MIPIPIHSMKFPRSFLYLQKRMQRCQKRLDKNQFRTVEFQCDFQLHFEKLKQLRTQK
jgi:hypothetical protein